MTKRKSELTSAGIDSGWPHQVAMLGTHCLGKLGLAQAEFSEGLSLCARGHRVFWNDEWYNVKCFSLREDAEAFMKQFGGEWFDPRDKGRGSDWFKWYKGGKPKG